MCSFIKVNLLIVVVFFFVDYGWKKLVFFEYVEWVDWGNYVGID